MTFSPRNRFPTLPRPAEPPGDQARPRDEIEDPNWPLVIVPVAGDSALPHPVTPVDLDDFVRAIARRTLAGLESERDTPREARASDPHYVLDVVGQVIREIVAEAEVETEPARA